MPFYLLPGPSDRTLDQHIRELCQHHKTVYRKMAINIANAEISMKRFNDRHRTTRLFQKGEIVKLQTGRATRVDQSKLQARFRVTEIVRSLGKDNYEIRLPEGNNIHRVVHAQKLEKFWRADKTKFPVAQQPKPSILPTHTSKQRPEKGTYPIRKYLLRNWTYIPPCYYVQRDTASKDLGWAYENNALIGYIIVCEKVNGILREIGITKANTAAVRSHKQIKYHQEWSIIHNTWAGKAPRAAPVGRTATVKHTKLDASSELNLYPVVQEQFTEQGLPMYYTREVIATPVATEKWAPLGAEFCPPLQMHFRADASHAIDLTPSLSTDRVVPGGIGTLPYCASQSIGKSLPIEPTIIPKDTCRFHQIDRAENDGRSIRCGDMACGRQLDATNDAETRNAKREGAGDRQGEGDGRHGRKRSDEEEEPLRAYARRFHGWTLESSCTGMLWGRFGGFKWTFQVAGTAWSRCGRAGAWSVVLGKCDQSRRRGSCSLHGSLRDPNLGSSPRTWTTVDFTGVFLAYNRYRFCSIIYPLSWSRGFKGTCPGLCSSHRRKEQATNRSVSVCATLTDFVYI